MKKAYNVSKLYEEAKSSLKYLSVLMFFFLGFQSQMVAQATNPDAINPNAVTNQKLKDLNQNFNLASVNEEEFRQNLRDFGTSLMAVAESDPMKEIEQQFSIDFLRTISTNLDRSPDVQSAVQSAYISSINSDIVVRHQDDIDFDDIVEDIIRIID